VHLTEVKVVDRRKGIVEARSGLGRLRLTWQGAPPPEDGDHDVEVEIPDVLEWGREIWRAADGVPLPPPPKGQRLRGRLVGLDEHGVATSAPARGFCSSRR